MAQQYYKQKEIEADIIINKARLESDNLIKNAESQLLVEVAERKEKINKLLTKKQEVGAAYLKSLNDMADIRIKRNEKKALQKLEDLKHRELKKIAKIRQVEIDHQNEFKISSKNEFNLEKEICY